jgi:hypothetical protein
MSSKGFGSSTGKVRLLGVALMALGLVALVQQQILLRRPPRLRSVAIQSIRSGAAALDVRFSRTMDRKSVAENSRLAPHQPHQWFGQQDQFRLLLDPGALIRSPQKLVLAGRDQRGLALAKRSLWWDPRSYLVAVMVEEQGEQLKLRRDDGSWLPLSSVEQRILQIEPLGNGKGVAFVTDNDPSKLEVLLRQLTPRAISDQVQGLADPLPGAIQSLASGSLLFAHLSSNQRGELLVQVGGIEVGSDRTWIRSANAKRRDLDLEVAGAIRLLPDGSGLVVPSYDGLDLLPMNPEQQGNAPQSLPGSRELKSFCSGSGRAVLLRNWPDYRRSIELVIPGQPPRQVWLGDAGVMATACDNRGEKIWIVLRDASPILRDELLLVDSSGSVLKRRFFPGWYLASGAVLDVDPATNRLLTVMTDGDGSKRRAALIDGSSLEYELLKPQVVLARWLPAGGELDEFHQVRR